MKKSSHKGVYWRTQLPVDYIDTSLVINTWETVVADLSGGKPVRLWFIAIEQTNNGATDEDLELEITLNGKAYTVSATGATSGEICYVKPSWSLAAGDWVFSVSASVHSVGAYALATNMVVPFNVESVGLIRVRQTSDVDGTSAQIEVNIIWDCLEP